MYKLSYLLTYLLTKWHLDTSSRLATIDMGRKVGAGSLFRGVGSPSNTMRFRGFTTMRYINLRLTYLMSPGPRPTSVPSDILINPAVKPQQTWAENPTQCGLDEAYLRTKWHFDQSSRLAITGMGRKIGEELCSLFEAGWSRVPI